MECLNRHSGHFHQQTFSEICTCKVRSGDHKENLFDPLRKGEFIFRIVLISDTRFFFKFKSRQTKKR